MIYAASKDSFRKELEGEALHVSRCKGSSLLPSRRWPGLVPQRQWQKGSLCRTCPHEHHEHHPHLDVERRNGRAPWR